MRSFNCLWHQTGDIFLEHEGKTYDKIYWMRGDSKKYPKHMFCEEMRIKRPFLHIILSIKDSFQQQINYNGNSFGNKCYRCNEGSLYL